MCLSLCVCFMYICNDVHIYIGVSEHALACSSCVTRARSVATSLLSFSPPPKPAKPPRGAKVVMRPRRAGCVQCGHGSAYAATALARLEGAARPQRSCTAAAA